MGFLNRLFGDNPQQPQPAAPLASSDEQALARYRYLLRTAPPEAVEQAHAEAFAQLTAAQRAQVLKELSQGLPASERSSAPTTADPQTLARMATRAEMRQPGTLERSFGGMGMGSMFAGSLLSSIAGTFIGSAIAHQFLGGFQDSPQADAQTSAAEPEANPEEYAANDGVDDGGGDMGGDDFGGDFGDV